MLALSIMENLTSMAVLLPNLKFDVMCRTKSLVVGEISMEFTELLKFMWQEFSGATGKSIIFMALFERSV